MEFSRCARIRSECAPVPQNSTAWNVEVDVVLGELGIWTDSRGEFIEHGFAGGKPMNRASAYRHELAVSLERR